MKRTGLFVIWIPLLLLIGGTLVFRLTCLDLVISNFFYHAENSAFFVAWEPWFSIYRYGIIPAYAMAVFGLVLLAGGCLAERLKKYRKIGLFLLVFLIVGSVFLVNGIFKEHWGRPRPAEIQQFNGEKPFLPVLHKGTSGEGSSFPSGHASAGYCLSAPFFFLWPRGSRKWAFFFSGVWNLLRDPYGIRAHCPRGAFRKRHTLVRGDCLFHGPCAALPVRVSQKNVLGLDSGHKPAAKS